MTTVGLAPWFSVAELIQPVPVAVGVDVVTDTEAAVPPSAVTPCVVPLSANICIR